MAKESRGVVGDLFSKKIKTHDRPGFLPVGEGVERVRQGGYGYQAELNEAYHEIQETFLETHKCDLFEMELFPKEAQIIVTVERSPYREIFSRFVRWQRELGHLDRVSKRWYATKPRCESGNRGFVPIGLREVVPLLLLLSSGVSLSLLFLAAEILSLNPRCAKRAAGGRPRGPRWQRPPSEAPPLERGRLQGTCWRRGGAGGAPPVPPSPWSDPPDAADRFDSRVRRGRRTLFWQARGLAMGAFAASLNRLQRWQGREPGAAQV